MPLFNNYNHYLQSGGQNPPPYQGIPQGFLHGIPQGIPQRIPQGIPQGISQRFPHVIHPSNGTHDQQSYKQVSIEEMLQLACQQAQEQQERLQRAHQQRQAKSQQLARQQAQEQQERLQRAHQQ